MKIQKGVRRLLLALMASLLLLTAFFGLSSLKTGAKAAHAAEGDPFAVKTGETYTAYPTLERALEAAMPEGDVYTVYAISGTHIPVSETLKITKDVVLTSIAYQDGSWSKASSPAVLTRAEGFTDALIHVFTAGSLTLENITLDGTGNALSAAIVTAGELTLSEGASVINNRNTSSASFGGAVHATDAWAQVTVAGASLEYNAAEAGAAIFAEGGANVSVQSGNIRYNVSAADRGTLAVRSGAKLTIKGGRVYAGEGNKNAVYVYGNASDAGLLHVNNAYIFRNTDRIYLENGATADVTGYSGNPLPVAVAHDRPDGAIATRTKGSDPWSEVLTVVDPEKPEAPADYFSSYEYRTRYERALARDEVEEFGYGGLGVNVSQEKDERTLTLHAVFADGEVGEVTVVINTQSATVKAGAYDFNFNMYLTGEIAAWSLTVNGVTHTFGPIKLIRVDSTTGKYTVPEGTSYLTEGNEIKALSETQGILPNDIAITSDGVATFYLQDGEVLRERKVFVGVRVEPVDPNAVQGGIYDAEISEIVGINNTLTFYGSDDYEYALLKGGVMQGNWTKPSEGTGKVVFTNLVANTEYLLIARRPTDGWLLPSAYVEIDTYKSLSAEENEARNGFADAYRKLFEEDPITAVKLEKAFSVYAKLLEDYEWVAKLPHLIEWLNAMKASLPQAFAAEWRNNNKTILAVAESELKDTTRGDYRTLAETAARSYFDLAKHVAEFLGANNVNAANIDVEAVAKAAQELLKGDMTENVMPKVRKIACLDIEAADLDAAKKYDLDSETESKQVQNLHDISEAYYKLVGEQTDIESDSALNEIYRLVEVAKVKLTVRAYYERLLLNKSEENFSRPELENKLKGLMEALTVLEENFESAAYASKLALYQEYGELWLSGLFGVTLPDSMLGKLYDKELARIMEVKLAEMSDSALAKCEQEIDEILREAEHKRVLQLYFEGLLAPEEEGRLNILDLQDGVENSAVRAALDSAFEAIVAAEGEAARAAAVEAGKLAIYRALASELLKEHYGDRGLYPATSALLDEVYENALAEIGKADAGNIALSERAIERIYEGAKLKLKVTQYFEAFTEHAPAESTLRGIYTKIDNAGAALVGNAMVAEKTKAAYNGMLDLYKEHANLVLDGYAADYADVAGTTPFISTARTEIAAVAFGEDFTDGALSELEAEIETYRENALQKLELQRYYNKVAAKDASLDLAASLKKELNGIEEAATVAEKTARGFEAKRNLYADFTRAALEKVYKEQGYAADSATLRKYIETEAEERLAAIVCEDYTDGETLEIEEKMDEVRYAIVWKLALQNYFDELTAEGARGSRWATILQVILERELKSVDSAEGEADKAKASYEGMLELYKQYGRSEVLIAIYTEGGYAEADSAALLEIANAAMQTITDLAYGEGTNYAAQLADLEEEINTIVADCDAELILTAYFETLTELTDDGNVADFEAELARLVAEVKTLEDNGKKHDFAVEKKAELLDFYVKRVYAEFIAAHPVVTKEFAEIVGDDYTALADARIAFRRLSDDVQAYMHTLAPEYGNDFDPDQRTSNQYYLKLNDYHMKSTFEQLRAQKASELSKLYLDYEADEALTAQLEEIRTRRIAEMYAIVYEQYSKEGANNDPRTNGYVVGLVKTLRDVLAEAENELAAAIASDEINKFCASLEEELAGYIQSRLKDIDKNAVKSVLAEVTAAALEAVKDRADAIDVGRAQILEIRTAFAKAVVAEYAKVLVVSVSGEVNIAIETAAEDEAKNAAMFEGLLVLYKACAMRELEGVENSSFKSEAEDRIAAVAYGEHTDAGLAKLEALIDSYVESAVQKTALQEYYDELAESQLLTNGLAELLATALEKIDAVATEEKAAEMLAGMRALTVKAAENFAAMLDGRLKDSAVTEATLEAATNAIMAADEGTMSAVLLAEEKSMLLVYIAEMRIPAQFEDKGAPIHKSLAELLSGMDDAYVQAINGAEDIWEADEMLDVLLKDYVQSLVVKFYEDIARVLGESHASLPAIRKYFDDKLASLDNRAASAYDAICDLLSYYAGTVIRDCLEEADSFTIRKMAEDDAEDIVALIMVARAFELPAQAFADIMGDLHDMVGATCTRIVGERLLERTQYPEKDFAEIDYSDLETIEKALAAYRSITDPAVKEYLDEKMKGNYPDFDSRLTDERDKAKFEGMRGEILAQIEGLGGGSESELVAERKAKYYEEAEALEYLPAYETEIGDYFHVMEAELGTILGKAEADVDIALAQEDFLAALKAAYEAALTNPQVRYNESGKAALEALYNGAREDMLAVEMGEFDPTFSSKPLLRAAEAELEAILEAAKTAFAETPVVAVAVGVKADGTGAYEAGHDEAVFYGIIENEGGMSGVTTFEMKAEAAEAPAGLKPEVGDKVLKAVFSVTLVEGKAVTQFNGTYIVKILLTEKLAKVIDMQIVDESGALLTTRVEGNFLVFETTHFSNFYLYGEKEVDLWWLIAVLAFILVIELVVIMYLGSKLYKKLNEKKGETVMSVGATSLLIVLIPGGAMIVSIILGVLIVLALIAIVVLLAVLNKKPKEKKAEEPEEEPVTEEVAEEPVEEEPEETDPYEQLTIFDLPAQPEEPEEEPADEEPEQLSIFEIAEEEPITEAVEPVEEKAEEPIVEVVEESVTEVIEEPVEEPAVDTVEEEAAETEPEEEPAVVNVIVLEAPAEEEDEDEPAAEEPVEEVAEEPVVDETTEESATIEEPVSEEVAEAPDEEPIEEPIDEPVAEEVVEEEPAEELEEEPVSEEVAEAPVEEPIEEPVTDVADETIEELVAEEVAEAPVEEPIEEPIVEEDNGVIQNESEESPDTEFEELAEEPVAEVVEGPMDEEVVEEPVAEEAPEEPAEDIPEEVMLPPEEIRGEVAASEVNALMQDAVAKTLIVESKRVADKRKTGIVNVDTLGEYFENGERVTLDELKARVPFFGKKVTYVKVLARGRLSKALIVEGDDFSLEAVKMIVLTGGHVIRTRRK